MGDAFQGGVHGSLKPRECFLKSGERIASGDDVSTSQIVTGDGLAVDRGGGERDRGESGADYSGAFYSLSATYKPSNLVLEDHTACNESNQRARVNRWKRHTIICK